MVAAVEGAVADGFHDVVLADGDADIEAGLIVRGEKERINSDSLNFWGSHYCGLGSFGFH